VRALSDWVKALPKAELHVHLEGTVNPLTYQRIARRNQVDVSDDTAALFGCHDFPSFLSAFVQVVKAFKTPQDFYEIATEYLAECHAQSVRHVELMFSPATLRYFDASADVKGIVAAIDTALEEAHARTGISGLVIVDMVRNLGPEKAEEDLDLALQCQAQRVVGIGLGGDEQRFPARDFADIFTRARDAGLRRTVHAGEAAGADSVQDAVRLCHAERIGHGVAAAHSPETMRLLRESGVAIDVCLTSNDITGAWNTYQAHPMIRFINDGLAVTLNSDDPSFFKASLCDEYYRAAELGLSQSELAKLAANSFRYSFAVDESKRRWLVELDQFNAARPA